MINECFVLRAGTINEPFVLRVGKPNRHLVPVNEPFVFRRERINEPCVLGAGTINESFVFRAGKEISTFFQGVASRVPFRSVRSFRGKKRVITRDRIRSPQKGRAGAGRAWCSGWAEPGRSSQRKFRVRGGGSISPLSRWSPGRITPWFEGAVVEEASTKVSCSGRERFNEPFVLGGS